MNKVVNIQLPDDNTMPMIGFGTWQLSGSECSEAVQAALNVGYRLIDTAQVYGNEAEVGRAIEASGTSHKDLFITTKIKPPVESSKIQELIHSSLEKLKVPYIDLLLIHWPAESSSASLLIWQEFIKAKNQGSVRSIGVSNFSEAQIDHLMLETDEMPAVNQIEVNPYQNPSELIAYCHDKAIVVQAYSPLGKGRLVNDEKMQAMADKYGVSTAQISTRWCLQHKLVPLPRSGNKKHIANNFDVFDFTITDSDMTVLDTLS